MEVHHQSWSPCVVRAEVGAPAWSLEYGRSLIVFALGMDGMFLLFWVDREAAALPVSVHGPS